MILLPLSPVDNFVRSNPGPAIFVLYIVGGDI